MTKTKRIILISMAVAAALLVFLLFSFDLVVYVTPSGMKEINGRWSHPGFLNMGYLCIVRTDDSLSFLERIRDADILIYAPYSLLEDGTRSASYTVMNHGEMISLEFSYEEMYSSFLSSFPDKLIAILYEENSRYEELYRSLSADYDLLSSITYPGRVSVVNEESLVSAADTLWAVIVASPLSSSLLYRQTEAKIVMDEMNAVSALSLDSVISIHFDWERMIESDFTPYYTYSVLHK